MKIKIGLFILLCTLSAGSVYAWQQDLKYDINVSLDDVQNILIGEITIDYTNNSPDTLSYLMVHLYPNAYKSESSVYNKQLVYNRKTNFYTSEKKDRGYIDSLMFSVDKKRVFYTNYKGDEDVVFITLNEKLLPGERLELHTPFRIKIPKIFSRMGRDSTLFLMAQWYPKPAVYDKDGWHPIPYADIGEFYGEFASFDVKITLPENYEVFSTGDEMSTSNKIGFDHKEYDYQGQVPSSTELKTIHLHQDSVHDFAWCASKYFTVVEDSITIKDKTIQIRHFYAGKNNIQNFDSSISISKQVLRYGSENIGAYPYDKLDLLFAGGANYGGMEYPCFATINVSGDRVDMVLFHEVLHNWFYGILANNERKEPFMDESFTSHLEKSLSADLSEPSKKVQKLNSLEDGLYYFYLGKSKYYKVDKNSMDYSELMYGVMVYNYGERMLKTLHESMGDEKFYELIRKYYAKYSFHHHSMQEFKEFLAEYYPEQKWFINWLENSEQPVDFKLLKYKKSDRSVTVRNKSANTLPTNLMVYTQDTVYKFWTPPFSGDTTITIPSQYTPITQIRVNGESDIPEYRFSNNNSKKGIKLNPAMPRELRDMQRSIAFLPSLGYNVHDGFELGLLFHNSSGNLKPLNYYINPMYGFQSKSLVGSASFFKSIPFWNSNTFKKMEILLSARSYNEHETDRTFNGDKMYRRYIRFSPEINLFLDNHSMDDYTTKYFHLSYSYIQKDEWDSRYRLSDSSLYLVKDGYSQNNYVIASYRMKNNRLYNPYSFDFTTHLNKNFVKFLASAKLKVNYNYKNKGIHFRVFGGYLINNDDINSNELLQLTNDAKSDYTYAHNFIARNRIDGIMPNQYFVREGGFSSATPAYARPLGSSEEWMFTLNTQVDLPSKKIPLSMYIDMGTFAEATDRLNDANRFIFNSGLRFSTSYFTWNLPLFYSSDYKDYYTFFLGDKWYNRMSFSVHIPMENIYNPENLLQRMVWMTGNK